MCRPCSAGDTKSEYKKCWLIVEERDQKKCDELTDHRDLTKNWLKPKVISNTTTMSVPNVLGVGVSHHNLKNKKIDNIRFIIVN